MGIKHLDLDGHIRELMLQESELGDHYISPRLTQRGQTEWRSLLEEAMKAHNDDWLAEQLLRKKLLKDTETYERNGIKRERRVNAEHAALQLSEGEFNRYYLRGLCLRAAAAGIRGLVVYRGKQVRNPRPESEARVGTEVGVDMLIAALRANDFVSIEHVIGVPGGPNSGLSARLPD